jgi:hypothetical protein
MWRRWYHVLVEQPDGKRFLIAIEASSAVEAQRRVAADWEGAIIREVTSTK